MTAIASKRPYARRLGLALVLALVALGSVLVGRALAGVDVNCNVNASGGFANCASWTGPTSESAKAFHSAGTPYQFKLYRASDGGVWGPWTWNDLGYHVVFAGLSGTITAQLDNQGTANPATYNILMS